MIVAKNFKELEKLSSFKKRIRSVARDRTIFFLSTFSKIDSSEEWIRFPYYHHVFDDERNDFGRHLRCLKNYGDFISLDIAVDIFEKKQKIGGRYFCVTFDDGFKNCVDNALPILVENKCPATFFISTEYIGCNITENREIIQRFFCNTACSYPIPIEFLSWDDCRRLLEAGMIIGSHTCSHVPLSKLNSDQVKSELSESKHKIGTELGINCRHFASPWGIPKKDFRIAIDPIIAKEAGYRSFLTAERGPNCYMTDPFKIRRDHMLAKWGNYQLWYFFSKRCRS